MKRPVRQRQFNPLQLLRAGITADLAPRTGAGSYLHYRVDYSYPFPEDTTLPKGPCIAGRLPAGSDPGNKHRLHQLRTGPRRNRTRRLETIPKGPTVHVTVPRCQEGPREDREPTFPGRGGRTSRFRPPACHTGAHFMKPVVTELVPASLNPECSSAPRALPVLLEPAPELTGRQGGRKWKATQATGRQPGYSYHPRCLPG